MTIEYTILKDLHLVIIFTFDKVNDQASRKIFEEISRDDDFSPDFNQLSDARFITENMVTADGLRVVAQVSPFSKISKNALLVNRDLEKGRANQYGIFSTESNEFFLVTTELDYAVKWLGHEEKNISAIQQVVSKFHDARKLN
ncbi:MAG: hypothetical protein COA79_09495 [Planctomycetota bacterium]|nr:MAG: hypothetical protein COA79_09495 [Planctomycetota bacterium]